MLTKNLNFLRKKTQKNQSLEENANNNITMLLHLNITIKEGHFLIKLYNSRGESSFFICHKNLKKISFLKDFT